MYSAGVDERSNNGSLSALEKVNSVLKPVACSGNTFLSEVAGSGYSRATFFHVQDRSHFTSSRPNMWNLCIYVYLCASACFSKALKDKKSQMKNNWSLHVRCTLSHAWAI